MSMSLYEFCLALSRNCIGRLEAESIVISSGHVDYYSTTRTSCDSRTSMTLKFSDLSHDSKTCILQKVIDDKTGECCREFTSIFKEKEALIEITLHAVKENMNEYSLELLSKHLDFRDVYDSRNNGWTLLHIAAEIGNLYAVKFLLGNQEMDIDCVDNDGLTPLAVAVVNGKDEIARLLLENGADVAVPMNGESTLLISASNAGHEKCVSLLLEYGLLVNAKNQFKQTALTVACERGHVEVLKTLISAGGLLDVSDSFGYTPLMHAVIEGHVEVVRYLLQRGCNPLMGRRLAQDTSLHFAASYGHLEIVKLLLEYISDPDLTDCIGLTPLYVAVEEGHLDVVKYLAPRCDLSKTCHERGRPIDAAAEHGYLDLLVILHEMGDDIYSRDSCGRSLLMRAAARGHVEIVRYLLSWNLPVNAMDNLHRTALNYSIISPNPACVKDLLEAGARTDILDYQAMSCLVKAIRVGHPFIVMLLILAGVDMDVHINLAHLPDSQSPLEVAVAECKVAITHLLVTAGCTPHIRRSALEYSARRSLLDLDLDPGSATQESRAYIRDLVEQASYKPHTLKVQCRKVVWKCFRSPAWISVGDLALPWYIADYLLLKRCNLLFDYTPVENDLTSGKGQNTA